MHGSVPGAVNSYVIIKDAVKRVLPSDAPYPVILTKADAVIVETTETTEVIG